MKPHLFRCLNLAWALGTTAVFGIGLSEPDTLIVGRLVFWGVYSTVAIGVLFDVRVAWVLCATQLVVIWALMGLAVSDLSFAFFTPKGLYDHAMVSVDSQIMNSLMFILAPASGLILMLFLAREHIQWVFTRKPLVRPVRPKPWRIERLWR